VLKRVFFANFIDNLKTFPLVEKSSQNILGAIPLSHILKSIFDFFETLVVKQLPIFMNFVIQGDSGPLSEHRHKGPAVYFAPEFNAVDFKIGSEQFLDGFDFPIIFIDQGLCLIL